VLTFPASRYTDQIDAFSQALAHATNYTSTRVRWGTLIRIAARIFVCRWLSQGSFEPALVIDNELTGLAKSDGNDARRPGPPLLVLS
jgi:hypothetical protein